MDSQDDRPIEDDMEVIDSDEIASAQSSELQAQRESSKPKAEEDKEDKEDEADKDDEADGWTDLLNNGDIRKKSLNQVSEDAPRPTRGNLCFVSVRTFDQRTGKEIESERLDRVGAIVGDYDLIHGLDLALPLLHMGEEAQVLIKPRFGYGSKGKLPDVPADCALDCRITLHDVKESEELEEESVTFLFDLSKKKKERGNFWFGREEYSSAISSYKRASEITESILAQLDQAKDVELVDQVRQLRLTVSNNLTMTYIRSNSINLALDTVQVALELDPDNVKALYRKATALKLKGEIGDALTVLQYAARLQSTNRDVQTLLNELLSKRDQELQTLKQLYRRMLRPSTSSQSEDADESAPESNSEQSKPIKSNRTKSKSGRSKDNQIVQTIRSFMADESNLNLIMAGSCFVAALFSCLAYYFIF
jgi:FK506-binding protein 8